MTKDRAISVDEARVLAILGWHHNNAEGWQKGEHRETSAEWYDDLKHAEATINATKQVSQALENALQGLGRLGDGNHEVDLMFVQRLTENEFLLFCGCGPQHKCILRIAVQATKP